MKLLIIFVALNVFNVILQTARSLATQNCGKHTAAMANMIAYGVYTIVLVYMSCDLSLMAKVVVVGLTNYVGVYAVKSVEEKLRKEKLWKVETTVPVGRQEEVVAFLKETNIPFNYIVGVGDWTIFNIFCATRSQSETVKTLLRKFDVKYFVSESKTL